MKDHPMSTVAEIFKTMDYGTAPEEDKQARNWIAARDGKYMPFINGKYSTSAKANWFPATSPSTGEKLGSVMQSSKAEVDAAVKAARKAQAGWAALSGFERAKYLYSISRLIQKHARLFAVLETMDNGKTLRESRDIDVPLAARHFYHHAGWAQIVDRELKGYKPYGVAGQIIPWNFPLLMLAWKVAPALATGNTVVLKPAEQTNLTAQLFADICIEANLPAGVFNLVTGNGDVGALIVKHNDIDKIAFTGSTEVGKIIRKETAGTGKGLTLELGGKSPFIVFDDADLDSAVEGVVDSIWFNQGEVCCAGSRLLIQESIHEKFVKKLKKRMDKLRVGNPLDKTIDMGSLVDSTQLKRITDLVNKAQKDGATIYQSSQACPKNGCYYPPTLILDVEPADAIVQQEIFGPVLCVVPFKNQKEAIEIANNTRYGLGASIWSENINMALEVAPKIKAGIVWINSANKMDAACGFGGMRESGYGREGGIEGLYSYMKVENSPNPFESIKVVEATSILHQTIDRTAKMFIGGKQKRPDGNYNYDVVSPSKVKIGEAGDGNRKDIRDAVEAAHAATNKWASATNHNRAQILYYIAENLSYRAAEFAERIKSMTDCTPTQAKKEVETAISRLFYYAGWADKYEGRIHNPPMRGLTLAVNEPMGVIGLVCPDTNPLLAMISMMAPAIAMGNAVVIVPSPVYPLIATDFYQILETSDVPEGVVNIVTGQRDALTKTLSEHDNLDAIWYHGPADGSQQVEAASVGNLKQCWVNYGAAVDWFNIEQGEGKEYLRRATQVKNIWVPYGE
jgi:aldehyde dehydrogenase (NAD+)